MEIPIPNDWDGVSCCRWAIKWPDSPKWNALLRGAVTDPARGRYWDASTGNIKQTQEAFRPFEEYNSSLKGVIMACDDVNLALALEKIADSIALMAGSQCCDGGANIPTNGGVVSSYVDSEGITQPIYGDDPLYELPESGFPPEFEDEAAYKLNKCQMANLVFDGWLMTMRGLGAFTVFNATVLAGLIGITLAGIIVLPVAAIPVMVGLLMGAGGFIGMFVSICTELQANKQTIVCDLYTSDTVEAMTSVLGEAIDDALAAISAGSGPGRVVKLVAMLLVNGDTLNKVLKGYAGISYPDVDCTSCEGCHQWLIHPSASGIGPQTIITNQEFEVEFTPGKYNDRNRWDWILSLNSETGYPDFCGGNARVTGMTITAGSFVTSAGANKRVYVYDTEGVAIYDSDVFPTEFPIDGAHVIVSSGATITVKLNWEWLD